MNVKPLFDLLVERKAGIVGETLFRDFMPSGVPVAVLISCDRPTTVDAYTQMRRGEFRIIARSRSSDEALALANEMSHLLTIPNGMVRDNISYRFILPMSEPLVFPRFRGGEVEASVDFECIYSLRNKEKC